MLFDEFTRRSRPRSEPETAGEAGDGVWAIYITDPDGKARVEQVYQSELDALRANKRNTDTNRSVRFLPYGIDVAFSTPPPTLTTTPTTPIATVVRTIRSAPGPLPSPRRPRRPGPAAAPGCGPAPRTQREMQGVLHIGRRARRMPDHAVVREKQITG